MRIYSFETSCENKTGISDLNSLHLRHAKMKSVHLGSIRRGKIYSYEYAFFLRSVSKQANFGKNRRENTTRVAELFPLYTLLPAQTTVKAL